MVGVRRSMIFQWAMESRNLKIKCMQVKLYLKKTHIKGFEGKRACTSLQLRTFNYATSNIPPIKQTSLTLPKIPNMHINIVLINMQISFLLRHSQ